MLFHARKTYLSGGRSYIYAAEGYKIYTQELLLAGIMKQQIEWNSEEYIVEP
jgi:hypothetical protein